MLTETDNLIDLAMDDDDDGIASVTTLTNDNEPLKELPPVINPDNVIKIALRVPSGDRRILDLEPSLPLQVGSFPSASSCY